MTLLLVMAVLGVTWCLMTMTMLMMAVGNQKDDDDDDDFFLIEFFY